MPHPLTPQLVFQPPSKLPKTTPKSDTAKAKDLLSELTTTVNSLDNQLREAQAAATISKKTKADHAAEIKLLQRQLQTKNERINFLENEVSGLEDENRVLEEARTDLEEQVADLETEKEGLEDNLEADSALRTRHEQQAQETDKWKSKADGLAQLAKGLIESNAKGDFMAAGAFMRDLAKAVGSTEARSSVKEEDF